jgi:hypothetical protein
MTWIMIIYGNVYPIISAKTLRVTEIFDDFEGKMGQDPEISIDTHFLISVLRNNDMSTIKKLTRQN